MLTHLRETFNHLRMHLFIYLFIKNVCITGEGPLGSFGGGGNREWSGQFAKDTADQ